MAEKLGIDLVWFGVLLAVNMQTSFMHPPFGFALFYLRSVAPTEDYTDKLTGKKVEKVTTGQIYWGAVPFVIIQMIMVGLVIAFPGMVTGGKDESTKIDADQALEQLGVPADQPEVPSPLSESASSPDGAASPAVPADAASAASEPESDDPMKALQDSMKQDNKR